MLRSRVAPVFRGFEVLGSDRELDHIMMIRSFMSPAHLLPLFPPTSFLPLQNYASFHLEITSPQLLLSTLVTIRLL